MAVEAVDKTFRQLSEKVTAMVRSRDTLAKETLSLVEQYPDVEKPPSLEPQTDFVKRLSTPMRRNNSIYAVYVGYSNGDLFEVVNLESSLHLRRFYGAPRQSRWLVIKVLDAGQRIRHFDFFDMTFKLLQSRQEPSGYMATLRPWYVLALKNGDAVRSDPYVFSSLKEPGITFSKKLADGTAVLALDFTLDKLDALLKQLKFSPQSEISMFGHDGNVIASSEAGKTQIDAYLERTITTTAAGKIIRYERGEVLRLAMLMPLREDEGETTWLGFSVDEETMLAPYIEKLHIGFAAAMIALLLIFPLVRFTTNRIVKPIKLLTRETEKIKGRHFDQVESMETHIIELQALSDSLVSMSENIQAYQHAQKELMDAFIKLIADAIDAKSPYTGGHCKRVPIIAEMLAKAAIDEDEGPFKSFRLEGEDAWEEFERGAWLHDCGKITTPEYVVDKATKLETIYNRIHEIRTRFEVVWRDIDIAYYERLLTGEDRSALETWRLKEHVLLKDEFAFIASANIGSEFMDEAHQARVKTIAQRVWIRHFDDRAGLSDNELIRYEGVPEYPLPAAENLLDDKPEYRIKRTDFDAAAYHAQGFKTEVPELLYNYGEIYNLCIKRGTLSKEERFKIEEHVIMTIKMLERLPLPENMKHIPEYAGTHHETMIGTGYPRQLLKEGLSIPARIMAIADIFEALTASDRPYKKGKTISQAIRIMSSMAKDKHIDAELFDLFMRSGIYRSYAVRYLRPEQIDECSTTLNS